MGRVEIATASVIVFALMAYIYAITPVFSECRDVYIGTKRGCVPESDILRGDK